MYIPPNNQMAVFESKLDSNLPYGIESSNAASIYQHLRGRVGIDKFNFISTPITGNWDLFKDEEYCERIKNKCGFKDLTYNKGRLTINHCLTIFTKKDLAIAFSSNIGRIINGHNGIIITCPKLIAKALATTAQTVNTFLKEVSPERAHTVFPLDSLSQGYNARFTQLEIAIQIPDPNSEILSEAMSSVSSLIDHHDYSYRDMSIKWERGETDIKIYNKVAELLNKKKHRYYIAAAQQTRIEVTLKKSKLTALRQMCMT